MGVLRSSHSHVKCAYVKTYRPYAMPYVTICGVDSGRTSMNYVSILSGKYSALTVNGALSTTGQFMSSFHMNTSTDCIPLGIHKVST